jgi:hypothetical protein
MRSGAAEVDRVGETVMMAMHQKVDTGWDQIHYF